MADVLTARKRSRQFLAYQLDWINDRTPRKLVKKARRTGFTFVEAYDAVSQRQGGPNSRDMDYWFSSADESSAAEFIEYCRFWQHDLFGTIADYFTGEDEDPDTKRKVTTYCIRCPNGRRITAMSSNPKRFRSKGGDVRLDEVAFHDDGAAMYTAAEPCTRWGGTIGLISTPNGEDTMHASLSARARAVLAALGHDPDHPPRGLDYAALAAKARELRKLPFFSYHHVTIVDAVAQGLVEKINDTRGTKWTREAFLQDCRDAALDDESYQQEYLCQEGQGNKVWLPYSLIMSCEHELCPAPDAELTGYAGGMCFIGVDVGRERDLTVIWVLEAVGDVLWTRLIMQIEKTPLPEQQAALAGVIRSVRFGKAAIDKTGIGLGLYEHTARQFGESRIEGVQFTEPEKHALAVGIKQRFEDRGIRIPADNTDVREDLHSIRKIVVGNRVGYDAPRSKLGHADRFWAACLAVRAAYENAGGWDGNGLEWSGRPLAARPERHEEPAGLRGLLKC